METRLLDVLRQSRLFFVPYLIVIICCFIIKLTYTRPEIYFAINARHSNWGDAVFPYITQMGTGWMLVPVFIYCICTSYRKMLLFVTSFAISGLIVQLAKHIVHAPRPKAYFAGQLAKIYFVKGQAILTNNSFPSGHTVTAFAAATVLAYLSVSKRWGFLFLLVAVSVAYSRMYLSQHFLEDVMAGSIIGVISTLMWLTWMDSRPFLRSMKWNKGLFKR
ncbi:phosphatase PAP2 family protein [Mucilaginibacter sp.]